ncbi:uncharacterized protein LOC132719360 [Ruditapes philippinarum]|uniref:uncharacterized protein LOC132719360 n=1 Tax=Ruditapes philippinarum TaxID=129788 RepID=UPI00295BD7E7|nr:uncharacterized protein LOC132719360 [Ruditapes philippinarum]
MFKKPKAPKDDPEPWRDHKDLREGWRNEYFKEILQNIKYTAEKAQSSDSVDSDTVNILMLGYVNSGKSSTINSIFNTVHGRICKRAKSGEIDPPFTQKYMSYKLDRELDRIILYDTMGFDYAPGQGILIDDIKSCIKGDVEDGYHFNALRKKEREWCRFKGREIDCVVYCVDALMVLWAKSLCRKVQEVKAELKLFAQESVVLVTKIDEICEETKEDIRKIYHSSGIEEVVKIAASMFEVSVDNVFPIKNYSDEMEVDEYKNIPLLLALQKAVDCGTKHILHKVKMCEMLYDDPWRDYKDLRTGWDKEYDEKLLQEIKRRAEDTLAIDRMYSDTVNIMMVEYIQSKTSSAINFSSSKLNKRIPNLAGDKIIPLCKTYTSYRLEKGLETIVFYNTMGLKLTQSPDICCNDITSWINGDVEESHLFNQCAENENDRYIVKGQRMHCLMYCVEAKNLMEEFTPLKKKMQDMERKLNISAQERIVLVTQIDGICEVTREDITKIFHSKNVKKLVEKAASVFEVSLDKVFPIRNYTEEMETDEYTNIPLLLALQKAVDCGTTNIQRTLKAKQSDIFADIFFLNASIFL